MKKLGMLGGMSWESTVTYYQQVNRGVKQRLGGLHSAKCIVHSVEFAEIEALQMAGEWQRAGEILADAAKGLQAAGAQLLVLCTNTMHKVAPAIVGAVDIPFIHIADATAAALAAAGAKRPLLLGTRYTMEQDFIKAPLQAAGQRVLVPNQAERQQINRIIFEELCVGEIRPESRAMMQGVVGRMAAEGADAVILGCTEIGLLVGPRDTALPVFDTALLHAEAAVEAMLAK